MAYTDLMNALLNTSDSQKYLQIRMSPSLQSTPLPAFYYGDPSHVALCAHPCDSREF